MQPSTNYVVGEVQDVQLANGETVKAVVPTFNAQVAPGSDPIPVVMGKSGNTSVTTIASSATSVGILAANPSRYGVSITNTDANTLYILCGSGTASDSFHTAPIQTGGVYEVPFSYTGDIVGAWAADGAGVAIITEFI